jgi:hypothetical protein
MSMSVGLRGLSTSFCMACLAMGGCGADDRSNPALDVPLRRGFYVSSDTACGQASNATLLLLHAEGLNGSRADCRFEAMESLGTDRYRIVEECTEIGTNARFRTTAIWEILTPESFRRTEESGWQSEMRYCEQEALPELWREIDLGAAIRRR